MKQCELFENSVRDSVCSRMFPVCSVPITDETSDAPCVTWPNVGIATLSTSRWTVSGLALLNDEGESLGYPRVKLSEILEPNASKRYWLSAKACAGILRRAEKRGKKLPPMLEQALRERAGQAV